MQWFWTTIKWNDLDRIEHQSLTIPQQTTTNMQTFTAAIFAAVAACVSANGYIANYGLADMAIARPAIALARPAIAIARPMAFSSAEIKTPGNTVVSGSMSGPRNFYSGPLDSGIRTFGVAHTGLGLTGLAHTGLGWSGLAHSGLGFYGAQKL